MSRKKTPSQLNKEAKAILLESENGEEKYKQLCEHSEFLKQIKDFEGDRFKRSEVGLLIQNNDFVGLSTLVRKLKTPFLTGVPHFDDQTTENARQKVERVLAVIPPEIMEQLTELDTPFVYELPPKPVVSVPELQLVSEDTIRSELEKLSACVLSALFALLTGNGVTSIRTECDNDPQKRSWIQDTINQMRSGEIPTTQNQETHLAFQHCRDQHSCPHCRALCAMMTIFRFGSNPDIEKQICRCVWHGSPFAEQAMRRLLILRLGPTCALAQVVCNSESPHRAMLVQILTELNVQETPQEKRLRQQEDDADKKLKHEQFEWHEFAKQVLANAGMKTSVAFDNRGYDSTGILDRDI
jgi:hypothetical protein